MTISNINRTGKTQTCIHNKYGLIERAPGKSFFYIIPPGEARKQAGNRIDCQQVLQNSIPEELVRSRCEQRRKRTKGRRCSECLRIHPPSEFVGTLCRGCYCGCGTLEEELQDLRRSYKERETYKRDESFFDEIHAADG